MTAINYSLHKKEKCTCKDRATTGNANASVADGLFSAFFSTILSTTITPVQWPFVRDYPGELVPERKNQPGFTGAKEQ